MIARKRILLCSAALAVIFVQSPATAQIASASGKPAAAEVLDRTNLPVVMRSTPIIREDVTDSSPGASPEVKAPKGAPNILLVMMDDVGFGATSAFGGAVPTPALDRLAANGLRYNNFHTTGICSPSRAALLTGRNHHAVGAGFPPEVAAGYPGYIGQLPPDAAPIATVLKEGGYSTAMFGKHHNASYREQPGSGPYHNWPTGWGFDYFYGFVAADMDQYRPNLFRGTSRVDEDSDETLDARLASDAIRWIRNQDAATPDKPFFMYLAPGSTHAPHQAPREWIEKFKGRFDGGWDKLREETFARQKAYGTIPLNTQLTPRPAEVVAWDSLTPEMKRVQARAMEVYAAQLAHFDAQLNRILNELERVGKLDQTIVLFIAGDNGASADSGSRGTTNELADFSNGLKETDEQFLKHIDDMGGPRYYGNYSAGWAYALNAPFPWFKQISSHLGGTRNGMVISWAGGIKPDGEPRNGFSHLTDIYGTLLDVAGLPVPTSVYGVKQQALDGSSLLPTFKDAHREVHPTQYFEMVGNRAIYRDGWMANTTPRRMPWVWNAGADGGLKWELYNLRSDFSQSRNLAEAEPTRLRDMIALWNEEATENNVFPINSGAGPSRALLPKFSDAGTPRTNFTYWGSGVRVESHSAPSFAARSFSLSAEIDAKPRASGAIVANGSWFGGWGFYLDKGVPTVVHAVSQLPEDSFTVIGNMPVTSGRAKVRFDFVSDGGPLAGGEMTIFINDREAGKGRIPKTTVMTAGSGETFDVGIDTGVPVSEKFDRAPFEGTIDRVDVQLKPYAR